MTPRSERIQAAWNHVQRRGPHHRHAGEISPIFIHREEDDGG